MPSSSSIQQGGNLSRRLLEANFYSQSVKNKNRFTNPSSPPAQQQQPPPSSASQWRIWARIWLTFTELSNVIVTWGRSVVSLIVGQVRDPLGHGAAAGHTLRPSPVLQATSRMAQVGGILGPIIDILSWVLNYLDFKSFIKTRRPLAKDSILPPAEVQAREVNRRIYKRRKLALVRRLGLNTYNVVRQFPSVARVIALFAGVSATTVAMSILGHIGGVGLALGGVLSLIKNSYVWAKTKQYLNKVKSLRVAPGTFLAKLQALQMQVLKDKIQSRKIRVAIAVVLISLGIAAVVLPPAGATAASFGALPAAIVLPIIVYAIGNGLYGMISGYRAKKQLKQDQLAAEEKISDLVKQTKNLKKEMDRVDSQGGEREKESASTSLYRELVQQIEFIKEEIERKTCKIFPEKRLEKFLKRIITNRANPEELGHLEECFELKNNNKKTFSLRFFRAKKEKITFDAFLQSLRIYGMSREKKENEQAVHMLYDILLR